MHILPMQFEIAAGQDASFGHLVAPAHPLACRDILQRFSGDVVWLVPHERELRQFCKTMSYLVPATKILAFPGWDCLPYDRASPRFDIQAERAYVLAWLAQENRGRALLVATASALVQCLPPMATFKNTFFSVATNQTLNVDGFLQRLVRLGYRSVSLVYEPGEIANRGGVLDVFVPGHPNPVRFDLWGDTVESMRTFDPLTQKTLEPVDHFEVSPCREIVLTPERISNFRQKYRTVFPTSSHRDEIYEAVSAGHLTTGVEHVLSLFYDELVPLSQYMEYPLLVAFEGAQDAITHKQQHIQQCYESRQALNNQPGLDGWYPVLEPTQLYKAQESFSHLKKDFAQVLTLSPYENQGTVSVDTTLSPKVLLTQDITGFKELYKQARHQGKILHLCMSAPSTLSRTQDILRHHNFLKFQAVTTWQEAVDLAPSMVRLHMGPFSGGFETTDAIFLAESDIWGPTKPQALDTKRRANLFIAQANALVVGDIVVHEEHGIARYDGLFTLQVNGHAHDCVRLIYEGGDKLWVPIENLDLLTRYGSDQGTVALDRLGGVGWKTRQSSIKKRLEDIAAQLLSTAAARSLTKIEGVQADAEAMAHFVEGFAYVETDDQARAIADTLGDLQQDRPMDRLICGDVGFGKTEVALRAAFMMAFSGKQVAVVTPTTLLCRQHYENFKKRFASFPFQLGQLSRFTRPVDAKKTKEGLASGQVSLVVGTHALLSKDLSFKNLGLLIIDEEQHFGVKQKEHLKNLQKNVHVLTLSATPIPRTLQLALAGARDMSIIATPPIDRIAIRTFIHAFDPLVVKDAIDRELHRGGQVFYVCPRVKDIPDVLKSLQHIIPHARIAVAHGQMSPKNLEDIMNSFMNQEYDVLLSTQIIESGIDLPTVNTLFVHRADQFGLAQLYQIRGRIGRGATRAYAYFLIPPHQQLGTVAQKRLEVLQALDSLGAGFQLASYDMDIRGAGNILGSEQSGHIREVGMELYQKMLEEAMFHVKQVGQEKQDFGRWSPQVQLGFSALIPESYLPDLSLRMDLYRRFASIEEEEALWVLRDEVMDRFGPVPLEVDQFIKMIALKVLCKKAYVSRLDATDQFMTLVFHENKFPEPQRLIGWIQGQQGTAKLRSDHKLVLNRLWAGFPERYQGARAILEEIAQLVNPT